MLMIYMEVQCVKLYILKFAYNLYTYKILHEDYKLSKSIITNSEYAIK